MLLGPHTLAPGVLLAPMEAVTDLPFRTVCEELGAVLTFTEFLSADALTRGATKAINRMWPSLGGRKFAVQIFGREPGVLARAAEMAIDVGASVLDINMGCPAKRVTAGLCGSALMREPQLAEDIVRTVRKAVPKEIPVTVKHRLGWDDSSINAVEFAQRLVDAGAAMITVHGRTRAQGFSGEVRRGPIAAVRAALPREIPVVANGDVKTIADWQRMKEETGCDAVMVGRGSMGNPWLLRSLAAIAAGKPDPGPPTLAERATVWQRHARLVIEHSVERMHVHELRKTLAWYSRGLRGGADLRTRAGTSKDPKVLMEMGETFFAELVAAGDDEARAHLTRPADPIAKSLARHERRSGGHAEADEPCAPVSA
ncbi:MAG TPA: tRNA dihydrouridine synthase DusB [Polyangia bacterium]